MCGESPGMFFVVSGEHPTLPRAELMAILDSQQAEYEMVESSFKLIEIQANNTTAYDVAKKAGFTEEAGIEIFRSSTNVDEIADRLKSAQIENLLSSDESFSVRIARFGGGSPGLSRTRLEPFLGEIIAKKTGGRVDLHAPRKQFRGIITGDSFHFGLLTYQRPRGSVANRRPRKRPAFHPSTMVPKLARCMVNLSRARQGSVFLDPFCGVGGIVLEACLMGCDVIGMDAVARMLRGARRNLVHFGVRPLGLVRGDARKIPLSRVDAIATDPPYGTGASTLKSSTRQILQDFLPKAREVLPTENRVVIASPLGTDSSKVADANGFKVLDRHTVYVHRSLTREILVLGAA